MTFTDGLTASAIILAVLAIVSEIVFFVVQTQQAAKSQREISDYVGQMRGVLGEIKGLTTGTREQQQEQFKQVLDYLLGQQRTSIGQELEERVAGIEERVAGLAGGPSPDAKEQVDSRMEELKREIEGLAKDIEALGERAAPQPPPALWGADRSLVDLVLRYGKKRGRAPFMLAVHPGRVQVGGRLRIYQQGWIPTGDFETLDFTVMPPEGPKWTRRLLQELGGPAERDGFNFPDDFPGASTDVPGAYTVLAQRVSMEGAPLGEPLVAHFFVEETGREPQT